MIPLHGKLPLGSVGTRPGPAFHNVGKADWMMRCAVVGSRRPNGALDARWSRYGQSTSMVRRRRRRDTGQLSGLAGAVTDQSGGPAPNVLGSVAHVFRRGLTTFLREFEPDRRGQYLVAGSRRRRAAEIH